jgi:hypothetical protein
MEVCTVCGAFLVINDTSKRLDAHMEGKQHSGYKQIREAYEEWKVTTLMPAQGTSNLVPGDS